MDAESNSRAGNRHRVAYLRAAWVANEEPAVGGLPGSHPMMPPSTM